MWHDVKDLSLDMVVPLQFARLYPLNQLDLPVEKKHVDFGPLMAPGAKIENPSRDYTPPSKACSSGFVLHPA